MPFASKYCVGYIHVCCTIYTYIIAWTWFVTFQLRRFVKALQKLDVVKQTALFVHRPLTARNGISGVIVTEMGRRLSHIGHRSAFRPMFSCSPLTNDREHTLHIAYASRPHRYPGNTRAGLIPSWARSCSSGVVQAKLQVGASLCRPPYDTIAYTNAVLTCAQKPTWVSVIYLTEKTKKWKTEILKSKNGYGAFCLLKYDIWWQEF